MDVTVSVNECCLDGTEFWRLDNGVRVPAFPHDPLYYFSLTEDGRVWAFDIRQFHKLVAVASELGTVPKNPYTNSPITIQTLESYNQAVARLAAAGLPLVEGPAVALSPQREIESAVIDLFHYIDLKTHLITDTSWLLDATDAQLMSLYTKLYRTWHYEVGWREKVGYPDLVFSRPPIELMSSPPQRLDLLRIIVDEITAITRIDLLRDQTLTIIIYLVLSDVGSQD